MALAAGVALAFHLRAPAPAAAVPLSPPVLIAARGPAGIDDKPAAIGAEISIGATLRADFGALCLRMEPGVRVCLDQGARARVIKNDSRHREVELLEGRVAVASDPLPAGGELAVATRSGRVVAVGAEFSVGVGDEAGTSFSVDVLRGAVSVSAQGHRDKRVDAHHALGAGGDVRGLAADEEARDRALLGVADRPPPAP